MPEIAHHLEEAIAKCMLIDQPRLLSRLRGIQRSEREGMTVDQSLARLSAEVDRSMARRNERFASLPRPTFPEELPVSQRRQDIARAIEQNQVVIVCGETGSGKTTQLPKICLELGRGVAGMIGHTQPRRIAARSVAARIASELQAPLGQAVGYKVRFTDKLSPRTHLKIMTDGILLAETQHDRHLLQYDTIIIDEAHERSLNIDFLLGYLKQLLPKRPDLKIIITSATIDPQRFSRHFDDAPIIEVSGRTHPVEVRYRPVQAEEPDEEDPTILEAILAAVDELAALDERGDILVFLSGEREIRETAEALRKHHPSQTEIVPLYARLSADEQNRVFEAHEQRRIVLATNVAETSLTVPGIRFVIDPGFARISRYSPNARVQRLPIERVSQASAEQRKGRCGRTGPGVCVRLYADEDFASRPPFTDPEIQRANLAAVILQMKALQLGEVDRFPFIDPPRHSAVREGHQTLVELGALTENGELTSIGRELSRLPVDPRIGRMILAAREEKSVKEVLIIASALATQDPRVRPMDEAKLADQAHAQFADERSDFLAFLKIWDFYHEHARHLSSNKLRKLCQQHYLSYMRLREWHDVHAQLHTLALEAGMRLNDKPASYEDIHRALLAGLLGNVGFKHEAHEYLGIRDRRFSIFPGSALFRSAPKWIMAAEMVETTRLYARTAARIFPEWIERLAGHLVKRTYTAPHWNIRSAHVEAYERVMLYGLTIVPKRRVHFGRIDPQLARETFIQHALVDGEYIPPANDDSAYFHYNRALVEDVRTIEAKRRKRDLLVEPDQQFAFFDRLLPPEVCNGPLFERWRRQAERANPNLLYLSREQLMRDEPTGITPELFPDEIEMHGLRLAVQYALDPGGAHDGVTAIVPLEALNQISAAGGEWLVPGMLQEKVTALIKSLPKHLRTSFLPVPQYAEEAARHMPIGKGPLLEALAADLERQSGVQVPVSEFKPETLPDYLRMNFTVVDLHGTVLASGRDLAQLRRTLGAQASRTFASFKTGFERDGITQWDFGDLPERLEFSHGGVTLVGYPAIVNRGEQVSLQLLDSADTARHLTRAGVRRLFEMQVREEVSSHVEYLPGFDDMALHFASLGSSEELQRDLVDLIVDRAFLNDDPSIRAQAKFEHRLHEGWPRLWSQADSAAALAAEILKAYHEIDLRLSDADNEFLQPSLDDMRRQLRHLLGPHFLVHTPFEWLAHVPRYLRAIEVRLDRLYNAGWQRDQQAMVEIQRFWSLYQERANDHRARGIHDPALETFRWMIEELRISLFAQELGTSLPVSPQRLEKHWAELAL